MTHQQPSHRQSDLFAPKDPPIPMAASERTRLLPLVSALLTETLAVVAVMEASDEDHA
jgi:cell division septation protein DedD